MTKLLNQFFSKYFTLNKEIPYLSKEFYISPLNWNVLRIIFGILCSPLFYMFIQFIVNYEFSISSPEPESPIVNEPDSKSWLDRNKDVLLGYVYIVTGILTVLVGKTSVLSGLLISTLFFNGLVDYIFEGVMSWREPSAGLKDLLTEPMENDPHYTGFSMDSGPNNQEAPKELNDEQELITKPKDKMDLKAKLKLENIELVHIPSADNSHIDGASVSSFVETPNPSSLENMKKELEVLKEQRRKELETQMFFVQSEIQERIHELSDRLEREQLNVINEERLSNVMVLNSEIRTINMESINIAQTQSPRFRPGLSLPPIIEEITPQMEEE